MFVPPVGSSDITIIGVEAAALSGLLIVDIGMLNEASNSGPRNDESSGRGM